MSRKAQPMTEAVAGGVAIYAMLSANSYRPKPGRLRFDVSQLGWVGVDSEGEPASGSTEEMKSGLAYTIYEKRGTNKVVFAFRGTDSRKDYLTANLAVPPFQVQYRQARRIVGSYLLAHPNRNVVATGHSLGGGLALCVSVHYGIKAFTFDPSPRVFDGIGNLHEPAERIIVYQKGEILQLFRKYSRKIAEVVDERNVYACDYPDVFGKKSRHRGDLLAKGLLLHGLSANPELGQVVQSG